MQHLQTELQVPQWTGYYTTHPNDLHLEICVFPFCESVSDRHKLIHNGNQKCEICKIPFTNAALLAHQRRYHANQRNVKDTHPHPHQCKICKKRFRWRNDLSNIEHELIIVRGLNFYFFQWNMQLFIMVVSNVPYAKFHSQRMHC